MVSTHLKVWPCRLQYWGPWKLLSSKCDYACFDNPYRFILFPVFLFPCSCFFISFIYILLVLHCFSHFYPLLNLCLCLPPALTHTLPLSRFQFLVINSLLCISDIINYFQRSSSFSCPSTPSKYDSHTKRSDIFYLRIIYSFIHWQ